MGLGSSKVVQGIFNVLALLTQDKTNGKSLLGTLLAPLLPLFLLTNPLPGGFPWGYKDVNTNPYTGYPTTGVTRNYEFTISRGVIAPDGYQRNVLLVNGAFPGPTIEANWGDKIVVKVNNNITGPEEGTSIHWHGFLQTNTPWEDGVPGVTQCPISPPSSNANSFTYEFQASLYGTSWYHSHYSAQYSGGIVGPIVVYGPTQTKYDIDLGPVMLSDWYHKDYFQILKQIFTPNTNPAIPSDNNLINGKMNFDCSTKAAGDNTPCTNNAGISKFKFTTGKTHRLRLINAGSEGTQRFSIDGHTMTVIANDFVPVKPYTTNVVTLGIGQRTDVLVTANAGNSKSAFWMRSNMTSCSITNQPNAVAAVYYDKADTNANPTSQAINAPDPGTCVNDDLSVTEPLYKMPLPTASFTKTMNISVFVNASGNALFKFDDVSARVDYNAPPLLLANLGNTSFPTEWNIDNLGTNSSVRIIVNNNSPLPHPMHLHGHNMYILHEGPGAWDGTIVRSDNPQRRDVQQVRTGGHVVIQFDPVAGVWPFHCHVAWHASAGFFKSFLAQPDKTKAFRLPATVAQTCRDWATWTQTNIPDQIDSGL